MKDLRANEFVDLLEMNGLLFEIFEFHIRADIPGIGSVTYYPKKDSLNIHNGNRWEKNGLLYVKHEVNGYCKKWNDLIKEIEYLRDNTQNEEVQEAYLFCIKKIKTNL